MGDQPVAENATYTQTHTQIHT